MKLPDFLRSDDFLRLKASMDIPSNKTGSVRNIEVRRGGATREEIKQLAAEGLEVEKEDVVALADGTLSYKDRRILLYIRDVAQYGSSYTEPRFHIADCSTLQQMRANKRFGRFVIATRDDGLFQLQYVKSRRREDKRLNVCQNCLDRLRYKRFHSGMRPNIKRAAVQAFKIAEFFAAYPKALHHATPDHTDQTAPTNDYSKDFAEVSRAYRQKKGWICETCRISLEKDDMQRYLHVHHINGLKNDNKDENLKAVCVCCHAEEPSHGHMTGALQYRQFKPIWVKWRTLRIGP